MDPKQLFDLSQFTYQDYFLRFEYSWEVLKNLTALFEELKGKLGPEGMLIHPSARIDPRAKLVPPLIIEEGAIIGTDALVIGPVIVGKGAIIGHASEVTRSILLPKAQVPHFNYVGDSMLGNGAHLGAGAILANLRLDEATIRVNKVDTGMKKLGAILGDQCQIGCNAVLNPGTILGKGCWVPPLANLRAGVYEKGEGKFGLTQLSP